MPVKLERTPGSLLKIPLAILHSVRIGLISERRATRPQIARRIGKPKARTLRFDVLRHFADLTGAIADEKHNLRALTARGNALVIMRALKIRAATRNKFSTMSIVKNAKYGTLAVTFYVKFRTRLENSLGEDSMVHREATIVGEAEGVIVTASYPASKRSATTSRAIHPTAKEKARKSRAKKMIRMRTRTTWCIPQISALASVYDTHEARLRIVSMLPKSQRVALRREILINNRGTDSIRLFQLSLGIGASCIQVASYEQGLNMKVLINPPMFYYPLYVLTFPIPILILGQGRKNDNK